MTSDNPKAASSTKLDCNNDKYYFTLTKRTPDSPYVMIAYVPEKLPAGRIYALGVTLHRYAFDELYWLLGAIEGQEGHTLKALQWDDEKHLVHALVRFQNPSNDMKRPPSQENEIWADPANNWRIVESRQKAATGSASRQLTYGKSVDGFSFPTQMEYRLTPPAKLKTAAAQVHATLVTIARTTKTSRDFRLSAFGLPDPIGTAPERAIPNYVWLIAASAACAALAMGCWYIGRRWRGQPSK